MICKTFVCGLALAVPLAMFGQKPAAQAQKKSNTPKPAAHAQAPNTSAELSPSDKSFLKALIEEDISEIELAKMALSKTTDPQVKQYVQTKILGADPQMRDGAEQIARSHGMNPPTKPNARQNVMHKKLAKQSGKLFDNAYMNYEADQQQADVQLVDTELNSTANPTVKAFVAKEKTPVVDAAAAAKEISKNISSSMQSYRQPANHSK